jgi:hypothetical protein
MESVTGEQESQGLALFGSFYGNGKKNKMLFRRRESTEEPKTKKPLQKPTPKMWFLKWFRSGRRLLPDSGAPFIYYYYYG